MAKASRPKSSQGGSQGAGKAGISGVGAPMDPTNLPDEGNSKPTTTNQTREAPAPGVPIPQDRYEWLKMKAKIARPSQTPSGQEDPSGKRKK